MRTRSVISKNVQLETYFHMINVYAVLSSPHALLLLQAGDKDYK